MQVPGPLVREVVERLLVQQVTDGPQALEVIAAHHPDVVLLDIRMPGKDGLSILAELQASADRPVVAMLTTFDTDEYIATALRNGAAGFLLKDTDPEQLPQLVRTLHGGGVVLSPTVSGTVVHRYLSAGTDQADKNVVDLLTQREREVLVLMAGGLSNTEIAGRLFLSVGTVKDHVSAILAKLDVGSRVQAALLAQRTGLLNAERPTG